MKRSAESFECFLTGSRAYGTPREDSDIDLVVGGTNALISLLYGLTEAEANPVTGRKKLQFGRLNIVAFDLDDSEERDRFRGWLRVNDDLIAKKPVTKEEAIQAFREAGVECAYGEMPKEPETSNPELPKWSLD